MFAHVEFGTEVEVPALSSTGGAPAAGATATKIVDSAAAFGGVGHEASSRGTRAVVAAPTADDVDVAVEESGVSDDFESIGSSSASDEEEEEEEEHVEASATAIAEVAVHTKRVPEQFAGAAEFADKFLQHLAQECAACSTAPSGLKNSASSTLVTTTNTTTTSSAAAAVRPPQVGRAATGPEHRLEVVLR